MANFRKLILLGPASVLLLVMLHGRAAAGSPSAVRVVLLRNGQILRGEVTPGSDRYEVAVPGGQISVNAAEVEFCCGSLEEVYRYRRARMTLASGRDYLELARWCREQGLLDHAAGALAKAEALEPTNPFVPLLHRELDLARSKAAAPPAQPKRKMTAGGERPAGMTPDELDRLVRELPPTSVETFVETVQPLLANTCAAAACHGSRSTSEFRLLRPPAGRLPSRRVTQRNLSEVLRWVDREDPDASPLLRLPIQAHGAQAAVFDQGNAVQYEQLVAWVRRAASPENPSPLAVSPSLVTTETPQAGAKQAAYLAPVTEHPAARSTPPPSWAAEIAGLQLEMPGTGSLGENSPRPAAVEGTAPADARRPHLISIPRDPFDPEIFNRRFSPQ